MRRVETENAVHDWIREARVRVRVMTFIVGCDVLICYYDAVLL